jgi:ribonucleoside-diphosphate reductase alpha chain
VTQKVAFNSPVWFNVGVEAHPQCSACFINSVKDSMASILDLAKTEGLLFKYGSGTGSNLSALRSSREVLSTGGQASGPVSFMRGFDAFAGVIKSGGKTRRAAKMVILNADHPDIEEFIDCKVNEEKKAWALIDSGYDGSFGGEAYNSVFFQNSNNSVRATNEFMRAVEEDGDWTMRAVTDGRPMGIVKARYLMRKIAEGTHLCGDPGMQFDTTIHEWHTCKGTGRQNSTNPCSEYLFLDDTACNLSSLNLMRFKHADDSFDIDRFRAAVRIFITAQEILVDNASYPIKTITENSHIFRTLGLGYANLGALIMSYGLGYDSDEGRALAGAITAVMTGHAYACSAEMAAVLGPFKGYRDARCSGVDHPPMATNEPSMLAVIHKHQAALEHILDEPRSAHIKHAARDEWQRALELGRSHGYRNAQVTVLAPTGTIGFLMDCDTTGIEPEIALVKYKLLAGGGMLKIVNQTVEPSLRNLGYKETEITAILAHIAAYDTIETVTDEQTGQPVRSGLKDQHLPVFDCAFKAHRGTRSLHYTGHIRMMAAAQPFLSGAISKTVNLPENASVEEIMQTYIEAWQLGLKAVAIYRDGSKRSAPLNTRQTKDMGGEDTAVAAPEMMEFGKRITELTAENATLRQQLDSPHRRKMPDTRMSLTHKFEIAGHEGYITVGLYADGQPGELFVQMSKEGSTIGGLMDTVATLTSISLQYGVPLEQMVKKFAYQRFEPSGFTKNPDIRTAFSITDYVFRWMGCQFINGYREATAPESYQEDLPMPEITEMEKAAVNRPVRELSRTGDDLPALSATTASSHDRVKTALGSAFMGITCSNCGSDKVIRAGACGVCTQCGTSQGCS